MNYAIIGSGHIGSALARHFAHRKIPVALANTRGPASLTALAQEFGETVVPTPLADALKADGIILAVPFASFESVARSHPRWQGKIVIDAMNAFGIPPEKFGDSTSSQFVARAFPGAHVVKAFNHLPAAILAGDPAENGGRRVIFVASDDEAAGDIVANLAEQLGFAPIKVGKLGDVGPLLDVRGPALGTLLLQNLVNVG